MNTPEHQPGNRPVPPSGAQPSFGDTPPPPAFGTTTHPDPIGPPSHTPPAHNPSVHVSSPAVHTAPPAMTNTHPSPRSSGGGGKAVLILFLLVFMAGTGVFGYLWWQGRSTPAPVTSATPTPTPSVATQNIDGSFIFSTVGDKSATASFGIKSVPAAYRSQIAAATTSTQPYIYNSAAFTTLFTLNLADGYQGSSAKGHHIGDMYVVDITDSLKKDDPAGTTAPFGGQLKGADRIAALAKLSTLLEQKDTTATKYMDPTVFNPFGSITTATAWQSPELLDVGNGFKGYTFVGLPLDTSVYAPMSYMLLVGRIKDAAGVDRAIMITSRLSLEDEFATSLLSSQATAAVKAESVKKQLADIKTSTKLPEDTLALQKDLLAVYKSITISAK